MLPPHDDVATGNFQASEFAADLYKVSTGSKDQSRDYADPVEFFRSTFLTEGLRDLISRAVRRLHGDDNASPVINLQTNFGGGKTHSMPALWHLAAGVKATEFPQELQDLLAQSGFPTEPKPGRRVALVGNHLALGANPSPAASTSIPCGASWPGSWAKRRRTRSSPRRTGPEPYRAQRCTIC